MALNFAMFSLLESVVPTCLQDEGSWAPFFLQGGASIYLDMVSDMTLGRISFTLDVSFSGDVKCGECLHLLGDFPLCRLRKRSP